MSGMDGMEGRLRDLLDAAVGEPPQLFSVQAVRRRVTRRRALECVAGAAVAAVIAVAIPSGLGAFGQPPRPEQPPAAPAVYVYGYSYTGSNGGTVTPINTATGTPGTPIHVWRGHLGGTSVGQIVITPDGKT